MEGFLSPLEDAGKNKNVVNAPVLYARKVEEEDEVFTLPKVNLSFRLRLQNARKEKQLTQKDLAVVGVSVSLADSQKLNVKASVIQDYESGKVIPNPALISKMEKVLGVRLRDPKK